MYRRTREVHSSKFLVLRLSWALFFGIFPNVSSACPVYMTRETFVPPLPPLPRNHLRLYALKDSAKGTKWQQLPLQVDPISPEGDFVFFKGDQKGGWQNERISFQDRITFHKDVFGVRWQHKFGAPCPSKVLYEVQDASDPSRWGYLVSCDPLRSTSEQFVEPVQYDGQRSRVQGPMYSYNYLPTNQLIFTKILLNPADETTAVLASRNANQTIRADVKNFFNMKFDKEDVESKLLDTRGGPVGMLGRLTFFLRVLFFKIDLQLNTAVSFFRDSVHVPMVINFPVDAYKRLNPTSGILFSWEIDREKSILSSTIDDIPAIRADLVKAGTKALSEFGATYCRNSKCRYTLKGTVQGYSWAMNFVIPEKLVGYGFFPMHVNNTNETQKLLNWQDQPKDSADRIALYLETSGLPKGEHFYDFWITVAAPGTTMQTDCPQKIIPNGAIHF